MLRNSREKDENWGDFSVAAYMNAQKMRWGGVIKENHYELGRKERKTKRKD